MYQDMNSEQAYSVQKVQKTQLGTWDVLGGAVGYRRTWHQLKHYFIILKTTENIFKKKMK